MTRVFQRGPSVVMHHQRSAWAATARRASASRGQGGNGRSGEPDFGQAARQQGGVQGDHRRVVAAAVLDAAPGAAPAGVAAGDDEFGEPLGGDGEHEDGVPDHGPCLLPAQQHEFGSRSPGPSPSAGRVCPAGSAARCSRVSRRTCSTEDDERLPTSASERQVTSRAALARSQASARPPGPWGPPGWQTQAATSAASGRGRQERRNVVGEVAADHVGDARSRARSGSRCRRCPSPCACSVSGYIRLRVPPRSGRSPAGGPRPPTATTAAAPSPNSPLATRLAASRCRRAGG